MAMLTLPAPLGQTPHTFTREGVGRGITHSTPLVRWDCGHTTAKNRTPPLNQINVVVWYTASENASCLSPLFQGVAESCLAIFLPALVMGNFMVLNLFLALLLNSFNCEELKSRKEVSLSDRGLVLSKLSISFFRH